MVNMGHREAKLAGGLTGGRPGRTFHNFNVTLALAKQVKC